MTQDHTSLAKQLDELISLADLAWRLPQKHHAHLAHTVRFIKIYYVAALVQRVKLRASREHSPK
jgi:hypothetical protein